MDSGHIQFIAIYLVAIVAVAALMKFQNPEMTAMRIALWAGAALPTFGFILLIGLLVRLIFRSAPSGPEGNAYGFAIFLLSLKLDVICLLGGTIVAWVIAKALSGIR